MIQERAHETTVLDTAADPCYSSSTGGDEDGTKEPSRALLQSLRNAEVQRELQQQGSPRRGEIRSVPFPPSAIGQPLTALPPYGCDMPLAGASLGSCGDPLEAPPKILSKRLKWTVHTLEIFWWREDYCGPVDVELEDIEPPLWNVHVKCSSGEVQDRSSADDLPDSVLELLSALAEFF